MGMDKKHALIAFIVLTVVTVGAIVSFSLVGKTLEAQQTPFLAFMLYALSQLGYQIWGKIDSDKKTEEAAAKAATKVVREVKEDE
jgi:hypothetical protein